jgi:hypothetical protein
MNDCLIDYCETDLEKQYIQAYEECGNAAAVARSLNKSASTVREHISRVKARAAKKNPELHRDGAPEGYHLKGVTTWTGSQWVKTDLDKEQQHEAMENAIASLVSGLPKAPRVKAPKKTLSNLCTLYTFTDYHLGMFAWGEESGEDWDMKIAEKTLFSSLDQMVSGSPDSELAILNIQGDFLHWDGLEAVTPQNKHVLDADTRFDKLVELGISMCILATEKLLEKHKTVRVLICEGNHDLASSVWLRKCLKVVFSKNPRVEIDDTAFPYYAYLHGETMLGFHHGHKKKNKQLPELFASEPRYREMWGKATYCYIHTGHLHQAEQDMAEGGGAIVERHPTGAPRDAYAARGGWVSRRGMRAITYDKIKGEVSRVTVAP